MSCKNSNRAARQQAGNYWQLVAAGEPFRLLFPLGVCIGIFGVLLWPLHVWHVHPIYPGTVHARIMVEGFLTSFVIGFLGTALPRLLGIPRIGLEETLLFGGALVAITLLHGFGQTLFGDQLFFITLLALISLLAVRSLVFRRDLPPPSFVLVAMGLGSALLGSAILVWSQIGSAPAQLITLGRLLLTQAYLLYPIMGVGAFLLPRFFELPNRQSFPESMELPEGWLRRALFAKFCGAIVFAGFLLEAYEHARWGCALRLAGIGLFIGKEIPIHLARSGGGSLAFAVRVALGSMLAGYAAMALWPEHIFSWLHLLFISGFSLLTFAVASRVILGHSGQSEKFQRRLIPITALTGLVALAMLTRVSADWMPKIQMSHYAYAAISWIVGVLVWAWFVLPSVKSADAEQ